MAMTDIKQGLLTAAAATAGAFAGGPSGAILAASSVAGFTEQVKQGEISQKFQETKAGIENAKSALRGRRATNRLLSQARRARAANIVAGQQTGTGGGSSLAGALGSSQTNTATGIGDQRALLAANQNIARAELSATNRLNRSGLRQGVFDQTAGVAKEFVFS